jgi:hypothetical protein
MLRRYSYAMGAPEPIRLTLELVPRAEPIRGAIVDAGDAKREFSGWMQLCAALAEASNGVAAEADKTEQRGGS